MNTIDERKIIAYKAIKSDDSCQDLQSFSNQCQLAIDQGFQPYGEPKIKQPPFSLFIQAFVKYKEFVQPTSDPVTPETPTTNQ